MKERKKKMDHKANKFNLLLLGIELILIFVFIFSVWKVFSYFREGKMEKDFNNDLAATAITEVRPEDEYDLSSEEVKQIVPFEGFEAESSEVLIFPDIKVDLKTVREKYPEAIGWLYCPETPINYPVMQGADNAYFVDRMPNGAKNSAGSIFLDYRDKAALTDFASVLYGHNMKNRSMFGSVLDYRNKEGYFREHPFMFYFTENKTYRLEIFAGVNTLSTSEFYNEPENRDAFIASAFRSSTFASNIKVTEDDRIILLSTCSGAVGQSNRYILFAKLTEI